MKKFLLRPVLASVITFLSIFSWANRAVSEDQTLAEKLLKIMRANHQITEEQYKELNKEALREKASMANQAAQIQAMQEQAAQAGQSPQNLQVPQAVQSSPAPPATAAPAHEQNAPRFNASWKNGLNFESSDGNFKMHFGGRMQLDFGGAGINNQLKKEFPNLEGYGAEARRARLSVDGTLYRNIDYIAEFDFAGGNIRITDLYLTYKGIPWVGNFRVGHMKEPFSLEELTSDSWLEFTERSLANAFAVTSPFSDRNVGIQAFNQEFEDRMTWAVGGFVQQKNSSGTSFQDFSNINIAARLTGLPLYENDGCQLVHLGFGFRHLFRSEDPSNTSLEILSIPEWHLPGVNTVDTGFLAVSGVNIINPEAAFVYGPFSVQGEYFRAFVDNAVSTGSVRTPLRSGAPLGNPQFDGYYVHASYFITGEHRNYNKVYGVFDRPIPFSNFDPFAGTWGAWEVAVRYSSINLNKDNLIFGGKENNWAGNLVWYLNPNVSWMIEYIHAYIDDEMTSKGTILHNGNANIIDSRLQVVW